MNRKAYIGRINKVIRHIEDHLDGDLSLAALSQVAAFSPFHFHRLFKAMVGENVYEYVKRIRLERSAHYLANRSDWSITEIAAACGFASLSAFSRAFSEHFGVSPREYRRNPEQSKNRQVCRKDGQDAFGAKRYAEDAAIGAGLPTVAEQVRIETLPKLRVAYVRNRYGYSKGIYSREIVEAFNKAEAWMRRNNLDLRKSMEIGITYDNPDITESEKCRYDAAYTIPWDFTPGYVHEEVDIQEVPGGLYAVYTSGLRMSVPRRK